jgi:hypothetical protein
MSQQPPEWWSRRQGPRLGCADVTIVSIASITAFIVLLLILGRSDFLLERLPGTNVNPTVGVGKNSELVPTLVVPRAVATVTATPVPTATPTALPTATPSFKRASVKQSCRLRSDTTSQNQQNIIKVLPVGAVVKQLGEEKLNEGVTWLSIEVDDGTNVRGWMQEGCFN